MSARLAAVMAARAEPRTSLDFFPTPPWATRALLVHVLEGALGCGLASRTVWEPAAGEGHMAEVLRERFARVHASDIHDYGRGYASGDFTGGAGRAECPFRADWIITNPPFVHAQDFAARALTEAREGVALFVRSAWVEGAERYDTLFKPHPPCVVAQFVERVPLARGRWDPEGSTATAYVWVVWRRPLQAETRFLWIPPGQRRALTRVDDVRRFAGVDDPGPLFGGAP